MENQKLLKIQKNLKDNTLQKLKNQHKRYLEALKLIETLFEENETLKSQIKSPSKKTKKKAPKNKSIKKDNENNTLNSNIEIKNILKKSNNILDKVLNFHLKIKKRNYGKDIEDFINRNDEEQNMILAEAINMIQNYILLDLNPENGINMDKEFEILLKYLDNILSSKEPQKNLESILEFVSEKPKKLFTKKELSKIKTKIVSIKANLNNNADILKHTFIVDGKRLSLYILYEKMDEILKLSKRKNPLIY